MKHFMSIVDVQVVNNSPFPLPEYKTEHASGMDVQADLTAFGNKVQLYPGEIVAIPTGLFVSIPPGYEIQVRPRSGLSLTTHLRVANAPGTIDADYRGEIKIIMENVGNAWEEISHGDRIAQLVLCPVVRVDWDQVAELSYTKRGAGGFGSTGVN